MKTKHFLLGLFFVSGIYSANAQTISLTSATPASNSNDGSTSVRVGTSAGNGSSSTGGNNTFIGYQSGLVNTTGQANTFLGRGTGASNTSGVSNVFLGYNAGTSNSDSSYNIYIGAFAGFLSNSLYGGNIMIGHGAGSSSTTGNGNVFLGHQAGNSCVTGVSNLFLGTHAGYYETSSEKLYIANSNTTSPLIWGDFANSQLKLHGKVGIGGNSATAFGSFPTTAGSVNVSAYNLFVKGGILTEELRVSLTSSWADYVFAKDYMLKSLPEIEQYILENGHLPNVPSAKQVKEEGINVGEMAKIQQEKIEELTLYLIQQNKEIEELKALMKNLLAKSK
jgi:hypothetical protein